MQGRVWVVGLVCAGIGLVVGGLSVRFLTRPSKTGDSSSTRPAPEPSTKQLQKAVHADDNGAFDRPEDILPGVRPVEAKRDEILSCIGSFAQARTYEAFNKGHFAWALIQDTNDYGGSPAAGYKGENTGMWNGRLTVVSAGSKLILFNGLPGSGTRIETADELPYSRADGVVFKFYEKPLFPDVGRPFILAQLIIVVSKDGSGTNVSDFPATDPFNALQPLPPAEKLGKRIKRYTLQCIATDPEWFPKLPAGATSISTDQPKEVKEFFAGLRRPWDAPSTPK